MKKKPPECEAGIVTVFSVSPAEEDHVVLGQILTGSNGTNLKFSVEASLTLASALTVLQKSRIPIVVSERDLPPGSWKDLLDHSTHLEVPPLLIVTSRVADERLWAEALNLGAWDVLRKPFDAQEVRRVVEGAWLRWTNEHEDVPRAGG
ncbi:MAG: hypothetical protein LAQ30_04355 [Acidobacteriia bacterium]|nr:hypothetical protein [Terriglobia bacterium]